MPPKKLKPLPKANPLGDSRAEADHGMLDSAFVATHDYKVLVESADRCLVVGRRGSGKSALAYALSQHWSRQSKAKVITVSSDEAQFLGVIAAFKRFSHEFLHARAAAKILWKYLLLMEVVDPLYRHYKADKTDVYVGLNPFVRSWRAMPGGALEKFKLLSREHLKLDNGLSPEDCLSDLARDLDVGYVENAADELLATTKQNVYLLLDRLDEGYQPDTVNVAVIDGLAQALSEINGKYHSLRGVLFLRDNMFRSVAKVDPDYSRAIEGQVIRLHWDERLLFRFAASRIRAAYEFDVERDRRVWDSVVAPQLSGFSGFKKCLQLTLYRPRDLLALLNEAFRAAGSRESAVIGPEDIQGSAKEISISRLDDLRKEYSAIFPSVRPLTEFFANSEPRLKVSEALSLISKGRDSYKEVGAATSELHLFSDGTSALRALYSVGFIGIYQESTNSYVFCHDGREPNENLDLSTEVMIHPCYWMALNLTEKALSPEDAQEIHDEYDIDVVSDNPDQRRRAIGQLIEDVKIIPEGRDGAQQFEEWVLRAIRVLFSTGLGNIELHPNRGNARQRDVVGSVVADTGLWKRIRDDYGSRQVVFECKNYKKLKPADFAQALSYTGKDYGRILFIVCRDDDLEVTAKHELPHIREYYAKHDVLFIKLVPKELSKWLSKTREPAKHSEPEKRLKHLIDRYIRTWVSQPRAGL